MVIEDEMRISTFELSVLSSSHVNVAHDGKCVAGFCSGLGS